MEKKVTNPDEQRFQTGAENYASYLKTPEGRLRLDLAFANLEEFLPPATASLPALDLGGGTGALGVRLARLGFQVTLLDASRPMLDMAGRAAREAGVAEKITLAQGDAGQLATLFEAGSFSLILCHNILEYLRDPCAVLRSAARLLRDRFGIISILVRNQAGEVLKAALRDGDLAAAAHNLTAEWGNEALYGGRVRLFAEKSLETVLVESSLAVTAQRGIRVLSDYLPPGISRHDDYERILELECKLARRPEFAAIARYTQCLAHRAAPLMKDRR
jgi:SAM-dependent methyltransferase